MELVGEAVTAAARVRVRLKGTRVYALHSGQPDPTGLVTAARRLAEREPFAWAIVAFTATAEGNHIAAAQYCWPIAAGPLHLAPGAFALKLTEAIAAPDE